MQNKDRGEWSVRVHWHSPTLLRYETCLAEKIMNLFLHQKCKIFAQQKPVSEKAFLISLNSVNLSLTINLTEKDWRMITDAEIGDSHGDTSCQVVSSCFLLPQGDRERRALITGEYRSSTGKYVCLWNQKKTPSDIASSLAWSRGEFYTSWCAAYSCSENWWKLQSV